MSYQTIRSSTIPLKHENLKNNLSVWLDLRILRFQKDKPFLYFADIRHHTSDFPLNSAPLRLLINIDIQKISTYT